MTQCHNRYWVEHSEWYSVITYIQLIIVNDTMLLQLLRWYEWYNVTTYITDIKFDRNEWYNITTAITLI